MAVAMRSILSLAPMLLRVAPGAAAAAGMSWQHLSGNLKASKVVATVGSGSLQTAAANA